MTTTVAAEKAQPTSAARFSPVRLGRSVLRHRLELLVLLATMVFVVAVGLGGLVLVR